jgi:hypothetical protein
MTPSLALHFMIAIIYFCISVDRGKNKGEVVPECQTTELEPQVRIW